MCAACHVYAAHRWQRSEGARRLKPFLAPKRSIYPNRVLEYPNRVVGNVLKMKTRF